MTDNEDADGEPVDVPTLPEKDERRTPAYENNRNSGAASERDEMSDDWVRDGTAAADGSLSRRSVLGGLAAAGLLGAAGVAGTGAGRPTLAANSRIEQSAGAYVVEVDGDRALRLDPARRIQRDDDPFTGSSNVVFGHLNTIADGVAGATVGGGGAYDHPDEEARGNTIHSHFGVIAGGLRNAVGIEGEPDSGTAAVVGGGSGNLASGGASTVAGGVSNEATGLRASIGGGINNDADGTSTTVGGGIGNEAAGKFAAVSGGGGNSATAQYTTVGGGRGNHATAGGATIGGGRKNAARGQRSTIAGGYYNKAKGYASVVPGGRDNVADGDFSVATGYRASTGGHDGTFVVGDSSDDEVEATADDAAFFQMPVHATAFNTTSTQDAKTGFEPVDPDSVLAGVRSLEVRTWTFEDGEGGRHMGPTAEDFHQTFGLGEDDSHIATVDADGVGLAAIKGLADRLESATDRIEELAEELDRKDERIEDLESRLEEIETRLGASGDDEDGNRAQASP